MKKYLSVCFAFLVPALVFGQNDALSRPKASYEKQAAGFESAYETEKKKLDEKYLRSLDTLAQILARDGDLDAVVAVRQEKRRFSNEPTLGPDAVVAGPPAFKAMQEKFLGAREELRLKTDRKVAKLSAAYVGHLEKLQLTLTRQNQIDAALAVKQEIEGVGTRVDLSLAEESRSTTRPSPSSASIGELVAFGTMHDGRAVELPNKKVGYQVVAAAHDRWMAVAGDGKLYCSAEEGHNAPPKKLKNVQAIACGIYQNLALHEDGSVTLWGQTAFTRKAPKDLEGVIAIATGEFVNLCLKQDGRVAAWGHYMGRDENAGRFPLPEQLKGVKAIAAGGNQMWVLKEDGKVIASSSSGAEMAREPAGLTRIKAMASGPKSGCVFLSESGRLIQWGGSGTKETLTKIRQVRAGADMYAAQKQDYSWFVWGREPQASQLNAEVSRQGPLKDLAIGGGGENDAYIIAIK